MNHPFASLGVGPPVADPLNLCGNARGGSMLTRLREGTPDAAREGRSDPLGAEGGPGAPVEVSALSHSFGELPVIERIDLEAGPGEVLGIVGPSGCGKTTLLELVAGLWPSATGEIAVGARS